MSLLFDFPGGWYFFYVGLAMLLPVLFLLIVVFEAWVLYWFHYSSWKGSLAAALAMNLVSSMLGYVAAGYVDRSRDGAPGYYGDFEEVVAWFFLTDSTQLPGPIPATALFLLISGAISVVSEGGVLTLLRRDHPVKTVWLMTLVANMVSYVLLLGPYIWITLAPTARPDVIEMLAALVSWPLYFLFSVLEHWLVYIGLLGLLVLSGSLGWWLVRHRARV